eukprot:7389715-Prymnesium_polylepis.1
MRSRPSVERARSGGALSVAPPCAAAAIVPEPRRQMGSTSGSMKSATLHRAVSRLSGRISNVGLPPVGCGDGASTKVPRKRSVAHQAKTAAPSASLVRAGHAAAVAPPPASSTSATASVKELPDRTDAA